VVATKGRERDLIDDIFLFCDEIDMILVAVEVGQEVSVFVWWSMVSQCKLLSAHQTMI
jgi:hypothetical protein